MYQCVSFVVPDNMHKIIHELPKQYICIVYIMSHDMNLNEQAHIQIYINMEIISGSLL